MSNEELERKREELFEVFKAGYQAGVDLWAERDSKFIDNGGALWNARLEEDFNTWLDEQFAEVEGGGDDAPEPTKWKWSDLFGIDPDFVPCCSVDWIRYLRGAERPDEFEHAECYASVFPPEGESQPQCDA